MGKGTKKPMPQYVFVNPNQGQAFRQKILELLVQKLINQCNPTGAIDYHASS